MPKGVKGFIKGHKHSEATKRKIGEANSNRVFFDCDYCGKRHSDKPSHFRRKRRHFCSQQCYALYVKMLQPKEERSRFGTGMPAEERKNRIRARNMLNHYLRDKKIARPGCEICGSKAQAHHHDYNKPLDVKWLCFKHHLEVHGKSIHQNPELIKP